MPEGFGETKYRRRFVCYWWRVGWTSAIQLGFSFCLASPNLELHVPFGFLRIGWERVLRNPEFFTDDDYPAFGIGV